MIRRIRVAWQNLVEPLLGGRDLRFLIGELGCSLAEAKGVARSVLSELELVKLELSSIREELARDRTWPRAVTVSVLGHVLLDETPIRREASGGYAVDAPPIVTTLIGAETVTLAPGERQRVCFQVHQNVRRGAILWVTGPGRLEDVFYANWSCKAAPGMGGVFIVPRMMQVGTSLDCTVVGVHR